jgi:glucose-1-phosphate cytidylyltransferase
LANVDITRLIDFHRSQKKLATITAVQPPGRYGSLDIQNNLVSRFIEKPKGDGGWINGGFFVLSPKCIDYIEGDQSSWEGEPLERLAKEAELGAYMHKGFWQPMDTLREKNLLEALWVSGQAPWKTGLD